MRTKKHKKKGYNSVPEFVANYPKITVKLTNHVFDRLKQRMGWSRKYAQKILGGKRKINMSLSNSIVEHARGGWKIHIIGFGRFVIVPEEKTDVWVAVTYYPTKI